MSREKNLMAYGFVSILLLASFLMTVPANQYQKIFAQTEGETSEDNQENTTEVQENVTDVEIPPFENESATFVPPPEGDREAPPVPSNAIKGADLPDELPPKDTDSQPLSVSNRTELLEVLPANATKIIEHIDEDLKNSTGEGLLPPAILDKIISGEGQGNDTILDISTPEELDEIKNFSDSTTNQTTEEAAEEGEPISNITNATGIGGLLDEEMVNATDANATETTGEEQEDTEDGGENQTQEGEAVNMTNASSGEMTNTTNALGGLGGEEEEQQDQDEEDTEDGGEQEQAGAGQQQEEDTEDGGEQERAVTNATVPQPPQGMLNATNVTSMLNATGLEDQTEDSEDSPEDE